MIKAVIFDLDDTLISEREYIKSGYKVVSKKIKNDYQIDDSEDKIYNFMFELFELDSKNVFNRLLDNYKIEYNEKYIKELVSAYRGHIPNIKFYEDVIPCLNELRNKGKKTGIISDGYAVTQRNKINVLKTKDLFDKIILTDELGKEYWKPSPKSFEMMKGYLNIHYDEMMYIGDNPKKDFYIKKYYPVKTVRILRKDSIYSNEEYLVNIKEDTLIKNLDDLKHIL